MWKNDCVCLTNLLQEGLTNEPACRKPLELRVMSPPFQTMKLSVFRVLPVALCRRKIVFMQDEAQTNCW